MNNIQNNYLLLLKDCKVEINNYLYDSHIKKSFNEQFINKVIDFINKIERLLQTEHLFISDVVPCPTDCGDIDLEIVFNERTLFFLFLKNSSLVRVTRIEKAIYKEDYMILDDNEIKLQLYWLNNLKEGKNEM